MNPANQGGFGPSARVLIMIRMKNKRLRWRHWFGASYGPGH